MIFIRGQQNTAFYNRGENKPGSRLFTKEEDG